METKRKPSCNALTEGSEKRPRRLSNADLISSSPTTSDLFKASDAEVGEEDDKKDESNFGSPPTSDLFEQISERGEASPLNTSEIFESSQNFSENEGDMPLDTAGQDSGEDTGCFPLESSDEEGESSLRDSAIRETSFDFSQLQGALVFLHLPGLSQSNLRKIINSLTEYGARFSEFFHRKITHLITSNRCLELEKEKNSASKKILTDPSSRGAMILARTTKKKDNVSVVEKARNFEVNIIFLEEMNLDLLSSTTRSAFCIRNKRLLNDAPSAKVRKLRSPFIKVVDRSECYKPLVLEMKEWPDAFTMFSRGPNVLETRPIDRDRKITFCELCEVHFNDLQKHLSSFEHTKKAADDKRWKRVDALRSKLPSVEQLIENKIKQLK